MMLWVTIFGVAMFLLGYIIGIGIGREREREKLEDMLGFFGYTYTEDDEEE